MKNGDDIMPWCPNCRTEYQDGATVCSDCKTALVDRLEDELIPFFQSEDKKIADKLSNFFQYSNLKSGVIYDEENDCYIVTIDPKKQLEAKKLYQAFYFVERERILKGESDSLEHEESELDDTTDEEQSVVPEEAETLSDDESSVVIIEEDDEDMSEEESNLTDNDKNEAIASKESDNSSGKSSEQADDTTYVMKSERYNDLTGTVWLFMIFGIAGLIFVLLNVIGVISLFGNWLPNVILTVLFLFFIAVAISTNKRAKKLKAEIAAEEELTKKINEWLASNVTEEFLKEISDENATTEVNYLKQVAAIKDMLTKEFGQQNPAYLDRLIDEYYTGKFDKVVE